ncbi:glycosyltransferase 8 domain-containing protein 2 [Eucyclogobius newberryi]|uniref:glycosyltransferase 8 domain-containing protein 2 n=1 Tax=Eucyclogobius newberryi TaxID=166745 RepID=UPI003B5BE975
MALLRKINRLLVALLLLFLCLLLHSALLRGNTHTEPLRSLERPPRPDAVIPVLLCAAEERLGAAMATVNSIHSNTDADVFFYIVTLHDAVKLTRQYIEKTKLRRIKYKLLEFNPMVLREKVKPDSARPELLHPLNFVRFYLPLLDINHKKLIYVDDDVIVQGDIRELFHVQLKPGHAAAFASDCDLPQSHESVRSIGMQTTYMGFLDYRKQEVRDLGINPNDCSFNPGVFVADVDEWKRQTITKELEKWMSLNYRLNLYSSALVGGVASPPMLIVFHDRFTRLEPLWHVRHLGFSPDWYYADKELQEAQLLHWNGPFKPWTFPVAHSDLWERWFIPDPCGRFRVLRAKEREEEEEEEER